MPNPFRRSHSPPRKPRDSKESVSLANEETNTDQNEVHRKSDSTAASEPMGSVMDIFRRRSKSPEKSSKAQISMLPISGPFAITDPPQPQSISRPAFELDAVDRQAAVGNAFYQHLHMFKEKEHDDAEAEPFPKLEDAMVPTSSNLTSGPLHHHARISAKHGRQLSKNSTETTITTSDGRSKMSHLGLTIDTQHNRHDWNFFNQKSLMSPRSPTRHQPMTLPPEEKKSGLKFLKSWEMKPPHSIETIEEPFINNLVPTTDSKQDPTAKPQKPTEIQKKKKDLSGSLGRSTPPKALHLLGLEDKVHERSKSERVLGLNRSFTDSTITRSSTVKELYPGYDSIPSSADSSQTSEGNVVQFQESLHPTASTHESEATITPSKLLRRNRSLKYIDGEQPPTPPAKDTLKYPHPVTAKKRQVGSQDSPDFVKIFHQSDNIVRDPSTVIRAGAKAQLANVVHQPSLVSLCGVLEGGDTLRTGQAGRNFSFPVKSSSKVAAVARCDELTDTESPSKGKSRQSAKSKHPSSQLPESSYASISAQEDSVVSDNSLRFQLKPAFYSPSVYSLPPEYDPIRPSQNTHQDLYFVKYPNHSSENVSYSDMTAMDPQSYMRDMQPVDQNSEHPASKNTMKERKVEASKHMIATFPGNVDSAKGENLVLEHWNEVQRRKAEEPPNHFRPQYPSAMPTPLYQRNQSLRQPTSPLLASPVEKDEDMEEAMSPDVPLAPPEDLLTHFAVLNNHVDAVKLDIKDTVRTSSMNVVGQLQHDYANSIKALNDRFDVVCERVFEVSANFDHLGNLVTTLMDDTKQVRQTTDEAVDAIQNLAQQITKSFNGVNKELNGFAKTVQSLLTTVDKLVYSNNDLVKRLNEMSNQIKKLEASQAGHLNGIKTRQSMNPYMYGQQLGGQPLSMSGYHAMAQAGATYSDVPLPGHIHPAFRHQYEGYPIQGHRLSPNHYTSPETVAQGHHSQHVSNGHVHDPFTGQ